MAMCQLIGQEPGIRRHELAERFGVSVRTITEDVVILRAAGVPIAGNRVDEPRGYWLGGGIAGET